MVTDDFLRKLHTEAIKNHLNMVSQAESPKFLYAALSSCTITPKGVSVNGIGKTSDEGMTDEDVSKHAEKWAQKYGDDMIAALFTVSMTPDEVARKIMWVDENTPYCHVLITSYSVKWEYVLVSVVQYVWDKDNPDKLVPEFEDIDEYVPFEIDTDTDVHPFVAEFTQKFTSAALKRRIGGRSL